MFQVTHSAFKLFNYVKMEGAALLTEVPIDRRAN